MLKSKDLTGQRFGTWTVISKYGIEKNAMYWNCKCDCGVERKVKANSLLSGISTNCGCLRNRKKRLNLLGQKYNKLTVIKEAPKKNNKIYWECQCDCGNITFVSTNSLRTGSIKSCGCLIQQSGKDRTKNLTGQRFGKLVVLEQAPNINYRTYWKCICDCGTIKVIASTSLLSGATTSCGCLISKGEEKIAKLLNENNLFFEKQKTFDTCKIQQNNKHSKAKFDFYVNNEYIIEYDGQQHFYYTENGWNTKEQFEDIKNRDTIKNQWCKENNIPLIRIPYNHFDNLCIEDLQLKTSKFKL